VATTSSYDSRSGVKTSPEQLKALVIQLAALPAADLISLLRTLSPEHLKEAAEGASGPGSFEKRRHVRQKLVRAAKLVYHNGTCALDCEIRDISVGGCRIRLASPVLLPRFLDLHIQGDALVRNCEIRWRSPKEFGVLFLDPNVLR
jgi:hypothetical protein